jgi:hypothetical protein
MDHTFHGNCIVRALSNNFVKSDYEVRLKTPIATVVKSVVHDLQSILFPLSVPYLDDYEQALEVLLTRSGGAGTRSPFTTAVILSGLSTNFRSLDKVIKVASKNERFFDFRKNPDYEKTIIDPIRKHIAPR